MFRGTLAVLAIAGFIAVGCDTKDQPKASSPEVKDTAQKAGKEAANALDKAQDKTQDATAAAKDTAGKSETAAKDGADAIQNSIDDLTSKAKTACKEMKWTDAENYVKQIEEKKSMLPADKQAPVETALAEVKKLISAGKSMTMPK